MKSNAARSVQHPEKASDTDETSNTHTFGWSYATVQLGVLDDAAIVAFTEGECLWFAMALCAQTGGALYEIVEHRENEYPTTSHYVVHIANDLFADAEGRTTEAELVDRWTLRLPRANSVTLVPSEPPRWIGTGDERDIAAAATISAIVAASLQPRQA